MASRQRRLVGHVGHAQRRAHGELAAFEHGDDAAIGAGELRRHLADFADQPSVVAERVERAAQIEERADVLALDDHRLHRAEHAPLGVRERLDAGGDGALRLDGGGVDGVQLGAHRRRQLGFGAADALLDGVDEAVHLARDVEAGRAQIVGELFDLVRGDLIGRATAEQAERFAHALEVDERAVLAEELLRAREPGGGGADVLAVEPALGSADEVAVGEVGLGELARHVARRHEIDGAGERGLGAGQVVATEAQVADDEQRRRLGGRRFARLRQLDGALDQELAALEIAGRGGQLGEAGVDGRQRVAFGMRLEVAARALERTRRARRFAAAAEDLAEVHERARFGAQIAAAARRFQVALEVRLGAVHLAAAQQRHAGEQVDALAQVRLGRDAARAAEVHERLAVVAAADEELGDVRFHLRAWIADGKPVQLVPQYVQFLNFKPQAVPIVQESASVRHPMSLGTEDPGLLDSSEISDDT